jgi:signal transduction histidine kinase
MNNIFIKARIKLTLYYVLIIFIILGFFSAALYFSFSNYLKRDFENELSSSEDNSGANEQEHANIEGTENQTITTAQAEISTQQSTAVYNAIYRFRNLILIIDGLILLLVFTLSYYLSGRTLEPIRKNNDLQKRFIADASHELRTPLSIMKTDLEVQLRNPENPNECVPVFQSNLEEVNRMKQIVEDLLFISRIDNNQEIFRLANMDLIAILNQVVGNSQNYAMQKNISLALNIPREPVMISGDENKLKQAFYNVLKNAIDYSNTDGKVEIKLQKIHKKAEIEFIDSGAGISKENLPFVFDRFFRADNSRSPEIGSSGLGLSITKEIIKKHYGEISIHSSIGKGTKVAIILPLI